MAPDFRHWTLGTRQCKEKEERGREVNRERQEGKREETDTVSDLSVNGM